MTALAVQEAHCFPATDHNARRFDRIAITSVFGNPLSRSTWSAAPYNLARGLQRLGVAVEGIHSGLRRGEQRLLAVHYLLNGYGRPGCTEQVIRMRIARRRAAENLAAVLKCRRISNVLHTGTLDLPSSGNDGIRHFLYCDHSWALSLPHRPDLNRYTPSAIAAFEDLERESLACAEHVFTFGDYVRQNLIDHYGLSPSRVTAVGSGMGQIEPFTRTKNYNRPQLLFVAKHMFLAKGGRLLVDAFRLAHRQRPDLTLAIVGDRRSRGCVPDHPGIRFHDHLPWRELQRLFRQSSLLVQPMLNDPWGQVYLEAMLSLTPVLGLRRNGLPEILENGRHGFMVDEATPEAIAAAILDALSDPAKLAAMARSGQEHVLRSYSWDMVARRIAYG